MNIDTLERLSLLFLEVAEAQVVVMHSGLKQAALIVEAAAKEQIGHYQPAAGPFPAWAPLKPATEERKARMGYPLNAPLLATGEMRDSITHEVHEAEAVIGSTDPKMVYHELGTSKIPPRPVMGPAVYRNRERIKAVIGAAFVSGLLRGKRLPAPYDIEIR
jgi:phage gpG-like protein